MLIVVQEENALRTFTTRRSFHFNRRSSNGRARGSTGVKLSDEDVQRVRLELTYPHR